MSMKKFLLYSVAIVLYGNAQQLVVKTESGMTSIPMQTSGKSTSIAAVLHGTQFIAANNNAPKKDWIVELSTPSAIQQKSALKKNSLHALQQRLEVRQRIISSIPAAKINREFSAVMNGFAVSATTTEIEQIRLMAGVKSIYEDFTITCFPFNARTSTVTVQSSTALASGKGIKIGIIDTGIDYMHEALGGGFGAGFKVAGGYDFVNNDSDPNDDNGHGTHVAGIIAGNSQTIQSVAYNATLYAYKALDANGNGKASKVLAALEQAINDGVDIINLSLGSTAGNPNDALCQAVNRAVEAGIVVVAAAGNTGEYESITSPGLAKHALTVGAADGNSIASFSAKGPVTLTYDIKPDVVASGVGILSAKNGGGYVTMSGTSMATPCVTAIAAALKELHPDWTAFEIKEAIITHAKNLQTSLFAQGNGNVNSEILSDKVIVNPAHISYGFNSPAHAQWTKIDTITILNATAEKKAYSFSYSSTNPALSVVCEPSFVELNPSERKKVIVALSANNLYLANNKNFAEGYTGIITGHSNTDTLTIPFTFFKGNILLLEFSETPWQVMIHNQKNFTKTIAPKSTLLSLVLNEGMYDIVASFFGSHYVIKENIALEGFTNVAVSKNEAIYKVSLSPSNENGKPLTTSETGTYDFIEGLVYKPTGYAYVSIGGGMINMMSEPVQYFSPMSDKYSFGYALTMQYGNEKSYTFDFTLDSGITSSRSITYSSSDLRKVEVKYAVQQNEQKIFPIAWTTFVGAGTSISVTFYNSNAEPLTYPFVQTSYYSNRNITFPIYHYREAYKY